MNRDDSSHTSKEASFFKIDFKGILARCFNCSKYSTGISKRIYEFSDIIHFILNVHFHKHENN